MTSDGIDDGAVIERTLPVQLTQAELIERGQRMALAELKIETLKSERKMLNARITEQVELRAALGHTIDLGLEDRWVQCKWSADYQAKQWVLRRLDTAEQIETRTMTADDLQLTTDHAISAADAAPLVDPDGVAVLDWDPVKHAASGDAKKPKAKRRAASKRPPSKGNGKAKQGKRSKARSSHAYA